MSLAERHSVRLPLSHAGEFIAPAAKLGVVFGLQPPAICALDRGSVARPSPELPGVPSNARHPIGRAVTPLLCR
jgi:hypothetical protein